MSKEQTPIGYLFNGRFYKSIDELRGRTMSADNQPQPLFTENQCKEKVLEALEREKKFFCDNLTINKLRNTLSNAEWRRLIKIHFNRITKQK